MTKEGRIKAIDVTKGIGMLFVCLSHFAESYLVILNKGNIANYIFLFTKIASPTFVLISGITLGYLHISRKNEFINIRKMYIDRGIFLLTIGHILILITWIPILRLVHGSSRITFITDAIGLCLIFGSLIISRTTVLTRIFIAITLYSLSWGFGLLFHPTNNLNSFFLEVLFGETNNIYFYDNFPFIPWFSFFIIGTIIGEKITILIQTKEEAKINTYILSLGLNALGVAVILLCVKKFLNAYLFTSKINLASTFLKLDQKDPPGLVYLLIYGGCGLIMFVIVRKLIEIKLFTKLITVFERIGKTSLVSFIFQYFVYFSLIPLIQLSFSIYWPILFLVTVVLIYSFALIWFNLGYNKYITIFKLPIIKNVIFRFQNRY